ncbi:MAG: DUF2905 domain-containing protein [Saprospiraceae bacterium]|nr:DUF2905 domain-containing protein [Saprospiraceae bacterium]
MNPWAKYIVIIGVVLIIVGLCYMYFGEYMKWIGNLPGDIRIERENFSFYFPITTMILFSLIFHFAMKLFTKL